MGGWVERIGGWVGGCVDGDVPQMTDEIKLHIIHKVAAVETEELVLCRGREVGGWVGGWVDVLALRDIDR